MIQLESLCKVMLIGVLCRGGARISANLVRWRARARINLLVLIHVLDGMYVFLHSGPGEIVNTIKKVHWLGSSWILCILMI